jgi:DNA-binding NarL/FixJ family response regulator
VLLADDHPVVREGLKALISRAGDMKVVAEARDGSEAVSQFLRHRPDVTLMDLRMPGKDGVEAIKAIRDKDPQARIIVLTIYGGDEDVFRAVQAGAKGYVLKDASREELLGSIRAVHEGNVWLAPVAATKLAVRVAAPTFTPRELEILRWMATGRSNKEIASALNVADGTVRIHVSRILRKLGTTSRTEAVKEALRRGIVHLEEYYVI